jgi:hypothetical protein
VDVVGNAVLVQELVELLVVDTMRAFDFAVQVRGSRPDVDVADIQALDVAMELRLKLRAIVGLNDVNANGRRRRTSSMKRIAVRWLHASYTLSTRMRVQSSIAVN